MAKCMMGRPKTVEKAQAVFMLWVELEAVDAFLVRLLHLFRLFGIGWFSTCFFAGWVIVCV